MIRGFWVMLPLVLVVALDGALTLLGQPQGYLRVAHGTVKEASLFGAHFLHMGPKPFALAIAALAGIYVLLAALLPGFLGQTLYGAALLGHAWGASSWVPGQAKRWFPPQVPHTAYGCTLAFFVLLAGLTVFCWRMGGLLPAGASKPKPGKDAKDKKKDG